MAIQPASQSTLNEANLRTLAIAAQQTAKRQPLLTALIPVQDPSMHGAMGPKKFNMTADINKIYKFIVGIDKGIPQALTDADSQKLLQDPFATLILKQGKFPLTAEEIVQEFKKTDQLPRGQKCFHSFIIAEGGQIPWETSQKIDRTVRYLLIIEIKNGIGPDVLMSTDTDVNKTDGLLQVMSWDPDNKAYNYYQRLNSFWIWSGNSFHALAPASRGKGPFSGHINGGPIMKELRIPWQHWNSMNAGIKETAFNRADPLLSHLFFVNRKGGERLENFIETGIKQWNSSRLEKFLSDNKLDHCNYFLRQILDSKNVNLRSSSKSSRSINNNSTLDLPFSFFANLEGLSIAGINPVVKALKIAGRFYLENIKEFNFRLESDGEKIRGDTHFAFFIPEPAFEDNDLLDQMIRGEIISQRLAACLLMVDFSNPIYSTRRASLQRYLPTSVTVGAKGQDLDKQFVENINTSTSKADPTSVESEFLSYWNLDLNIWISTFESKISNYFNNLSQLCDTQAGFNQLVTLAESRRFQFMQTGQFEFKLTFATTDIPTNNFPLEITPEGNVRKLKS